MALICEAGYLRGASFTKEKLHPSAEGCTLSLQLLIRKCVGRHHLKMGKHQKAMGQTLPEVHAVQTLESFVFPPAKIERLYNKQTLGAVLRKAQAP